MIKFAETYHGEDPDEQMILEKKRFEARQKQREYSQQVRKEEMIKSAEGNYKLSAFIKE